MSKKSTRKKVTNKTKNNTQRLLKVENKKTTIKNSTNKQTKIEKIVNPKTKFKNKINVKVTKNKEKIYSIACIFLIIDQLLKILIKTKMDLLQEMTIIPNFFSIYYVENDGAAFSILQNQTLLLVVVSILCVIIIDNYLSKETNFTKLMRFSFGILIGGMIGNLIDRLLYGTVTDYLAFNFFSYDFPVFNFADIGITVGVLLITITTIIDEIKNLRQKQLSTEKSSHF